MALYVKFDCSTCENKNCTGHGLPTTEKVCDWYKHTTTNADRIRAMTDEELAMLLEGCVCPKSPCPDIDRDTPTDKKRCTECWLDWLKEEAK